MLIHGQLSPKGFRRLLAVYPRLALSGVVNSGKTLLLAEGVPGAPKREVIHTDALKKSDWRSIPSKICSQLSTSKSFVVAGTQVPRCLRKGLEVDALVWLDTPRSVLTPRQEAFGKGIRQIMHKWRNAHPQIPVYFSPRAVHDHELARMPK